MSETREILVNFGDETVRLIQENLANTGTNASGETSQSVKSDMVNDNRVQVSGKQFIYVVETGRRPGKMPPIEGIMKWLNTGKVSITGSIESAAWGIAKKISEEGSKLFRDGGRTDIITPAIDDKRVDDLVDEIANAEANEIADAIIEGTNGEER